MKQLLFSVLTMVIGGPLMAGDAGYFSRTCVSGSQRTVLTILDDYMQDAPIYTLILDGVPAIYNFSESTVQMEGDDGVLTILKDGVANFKTDFDADNGKMKITVYVDPRKGTIAEHDATPTPITIQLQCKDFWPNP